jgi:hypothetical protein
VVFNNFYVKTQVSFFPSSRLPENNCRLSFKAIVRLKKNKAGVLRVICFQLWCSDKKCAHTLSSYKAIGIYIDFTCLIFKINFSFAQTFQPQLNLKDKRIVLQLINILNSIQKKITSIPAAATQTYHE